MLENRQKMPHPVVNGPLSQGEQRKLGDVPSAWAAWEGHLEGHAGVRVSYRWTMAVDATTMVVTLDTGCQ